MPINTKFRGLSQKFTLTNGAFTLTDSSLKVIDNVTFFLAFTDWFRVYLSLYPIKLGYIIQKPNTFVAKFKTLFLGNINQKIAAYVPEVKVVSSNFATTLTKDSEFKLVYSINPQYGNSLELVNVYAVTFITII